MLAFGYKTLEEVTAQIDMNEQSFSQLQSLTFNEITENQLLSTQNNDKNLLKDCQEKIEKMYKLLLNDRSFEEFAL